MTQKLNRVTSSEREKTGNICKTKLIPACNGAHRIMILELRISALISLSLS
jgi:hypothetical protein